jgi:hypothetical protein
LLSLCTGSLPARAAACQGDCNRDGVVRVGELITAVGVALRRIAAERCPEADADRSGVVTIDELIAAVARSSQGCPTPSPSPTPSASLAPSPTPTASPGLGVRRFSIDPASSPLVAVLGPDAVVSNLPGFGGFLELSAGAPDPETGLAPVAVTGASDFIAVDIAGEPPAALCLRPVREALPVADAGVLACSRSAFAGLRVSQDHRLGEIGRCQDDAAEPCAGDGDCAAAPCFEESDCAAAGGRVETPAEPHPGFCNGALTVRRESDLSPPGTLLIVRDAQSGTRGLPVETFMERATPCGDEKAAGASSEIGLTSDLTRVRIAAFNGVADQTLAYDARGESFDCDGWTQEDGPGILVFAGVSLDVPALPATSTDLVTLFVWDD